MQDLIRASRRRKIIALLLGTICMVLIVVVLLSTGTVSAAGLFSPEQTETQNWYDQQNTIIAHETETRVYQLTQAAWGQLTVTYPPSQTPNSTGVWTTGTPQATLPVCNLPTRTYGGGFPTINWPTSLPTYTPSTTASITFTPTITGSRTATPTTTNTSTPFNPAGWIVDIEAWAGAGSFVGSINCQYAGGGTISKDYSYYPNGGSYGAFHTYDYFGAGANWVHCVVHSTRSSGQYFNIEAIINAAHEYWYKSVFTHTNSWDHIADAASWTHRNGGEKLNGTFWSSGNYSSFDWTFDALSYDPSLASPTPNLTPTATITLTPTGMPTACVTPGLPGWDTRDPVGWVSPPIYRFGDCVTLLPYIHQPLDLVHEAFPWVPEAIDIGPFGFCPIYITINAQIFGVSADYLLAIFCFIMAAWGVINEIRS